MPKKRPSARWVQNGPMAPWMVRYCQWLAQHPGAELCGNGDQYRTRHPKSDERVARASEYSGRRVQRQLIVLLERRPDVREYFEKLLTDLQFHARERAQSQLAKNFEARDEALGLAREAKDYSAIGKLTDPWIHHGMPKIKADSEKGAQRVTINLFGMPAEQKKMLLSGVTEPEEPDEIEFEVIPNEKLLTDGEDD